MKRTIADYRVLMYKIKKEIENSPGRIITAQELSDAYDIPIRELQSYFSYFFKYTIKEYSNISKLNYFERLIQEDGREDRQKAFAFALALGFSNESSLTSFLQSQTGKNFTQFCDEYYSADSK